MAVAARKTLFQILPPRKQRPAPRLANAADPAHPSAVHAQQDALQAAFTARHPHPRFRAIVFSLLILASFGLWAAIIAAAIHVGQMIP